MRPAHVAGWIGTIGGRGASEAITPPSFEREALIDAILARVAGHVPAIVTDNHFS